MFHFKTRAFANHWPKAILHPKTCYNTSPSLVHCYRIGGVIRRPCFSIHGRRPNPGNLRHISGVTDPNFEMHATTSSVDYIGGQISNAPRTYARKAPL